MSEEESLLREEAIPSESARDEPANLVTTFDLFKTYLDTKLTSLKEDLAEDARTTSASVAKKLKEYSDITFKYEGNKQQHKFNCSLIEQVGLAQKALERKRHSQVKEHLEELEKFITKRNKLIRLADKSDAGWDLVNEYLSDELASGSEDEKRIRKAEQTALRKKKARTEKRFTNI